MELKLKNRSLLIILGILSVAFALSINSIVSPILSKINTSFPEASSSQIQVIYSIVGLAGIPIVLLGGKLAYKISQKKLILCAFLLMIMGGLLSFFAFESLPVLYIASAITGAGLSLGQTMLFSVIANNYNGEGRAKWGGIAGVVYSFAGILYTTVSGLVAEKMGWRYSYVIMLWLIPLAISAMLFLPEELPKSGDDSVMKKKPHLQKPNFINFRYIFYIALGFLATMTLIAYNTNISEFTKNMGFGGAIEASRASSSYMLAGIPAGLLCGAIFKKIKHHYMSFAALLYCIGFAVCAWSTSLILLCFGSAIVGFSNGIRVPGNTVVLGEMLPRRDTAMGIGLYNSISYIGGFLSPYIINLFSNLFGNNARAPYIICMIILALMTVGHIFDAVFLVQKYRNTDE